MPERRRSSCRRARTQTRSELALLAPDDEELLPGRRVPHADARCPIPTEAIRLPSGEKQTSNTQPPCRSRGEPSRATAPAGSGTGLGVLRLRRGRPSVGCRAVSSRRVGRFRLPAPGHAQPDRARDQHQTRGRDGARLRGDIGRDRPRRELPHGRREPGRAAGVDHRRPRRLRHRDRGHRDRRHHPAGREPVAEPLPGAGQPRLDRPDRAAERRGGLGVRPALQFAQHERQAELVGQAVQPVVEQRADLAVATLDGQGPGPGGRVGGIVGQGPRDARRGDAGRATRGRRRGAATRRARRGRGAGRRGRPARRTRPGTRPRPRRGPGRASAGTRPTPSPPCRHTSSSNAAWSRGPDEPVEQFGVGNGVGSGVIRRTRAASGGADMAVSGRFILPESLTARDRKPSVKNGTAVGYAACAEVPPVRAPHECQARYCVIRRYEFAESLGTERSGSVNPTNGAQVSEENARAVGRGRCSM